MTQSPPLAKWFTPVAIIALIWNLMGVVAFIMSPVLNPGAMALLTDAEQAMYAATPLWATVAFAVAVFSGAIGSLLLIIKKAVAKQLLVASLVAVLVQMFHAYFISNSWEVFGPGGTIMPIMVILIAIYLVMLSKQAIANNWIH